LPVVVSLAAGALLIHGEQFAMVMEQTFYFRAEEKLSQELFACR